MASTLNLFKILDMVCRPHHIDRFTSITSTQLPVYNSLYLVPQNFVNAPFTLIPKILNIIREQKDVATLITPKWVGQQ